jgi:probable HAF family extracellular repeat protein
MVDLGTLGGNESEATSINDAGQIVGFAQTVNQTKHAAVWATGGTQARDLGTLGGAESRAISVLKNRVLGTSQTATGAWHAFVYDLDTSTMTDLNDKLPANSGWVLAEARATNAAGTIVGTGTLNNAEGQAFILSAITVSTVLPPAVAPTAPLAKPLH